jgi:hypothetical protein
MCAKKEAIKMQKNLSVSNHIILKLGVLLTSITQVASPFLFPFGKNSNIDNSNPQITPAGYTFAIWGLITLLALGYGIYQALPQRKNAALHKQISMPLIGLYTLFSLWLLAAQRAWLIITVIIFIMMFVLAFIAFQRVLRSQAALTLTEKILLEAQVGIYLGWCTIAIFANAGAAIKFYGFSDLGASGLIWQSVLLIGALSNAIYGLYKSKANLFLGATFIWAFIGIYVGLSNRVNTTALQTIVFFALAVVFFGLLRFRAKPM